MSSKSVDSKTEKEFYTDEKGNAMVKTTTTITTVTTENGKTLTEIAVSTKIEEVKQRDRSGQDAADVPDDLNNEMKKINIKKEPMKPLTKVEINEFRKECLDQHNQLRKDHGVDNLELLEGINNVAQEWADKLIKRGKFDHNPDTNYGENIYRSSGKSTGQKVVQTWYDEIKDYDFNNKKYQPRTGHFTQVVWKNSQKLGIGVACNDDTFVVVANYDPAGNLSGTYGENVAMKGN